MEILFENENFKVVDKCSGTSVHNDEDSVLSYFSDEKLFPVHRLDKATSGLLVLAKSKADAAMGASAMQEKECKKKYLCILVDNQKRKLGETFLFNQRLSKTAGGVKSVRGPKPWVETSTQAKVIASNTYFSLLECLLITGRTHQIRKHCLLNMGAVAFDQRYAEKKNLKTLERIYGKTPMCLHSSELELTINGKTHHWKSHLPDYFDKLIDPLSSN